MSRTTPSPNDAQRPTLREAAVAALGLSLLFVAVYGATNRITALRTDVHTVYFAWERHIPFVPAMIVPYMSIDLFFLAAPFLCSHRRELRTLSRRITAAILIAGVSFLLFPLELAVERPHAEGAIGAVFNWFRGVDLPYNLCPSLHIALRTILADLYARHSRGLAKWSLQVWFSLVGLSTLLTYQHHVIDVAGGFVLAAVCFYAIRETPFKLPVERNEHVAWPTRSAASSRRSRDSRCVPGAVCCSGRPLRWRSSRARTSASVRECFTRPMDGCRCASG